MGGTLGVTAEYAGDGLMPSNAPMSQLPCNFRSKPTPRWSYSWLVGLDPLPNAWLPGSNARVRVGPPLSASGASAGSSGEALEPVLFVPARVKLPLSATPTRLLLPVIAVAVPVLQSMSGPPVLLKLPATIVLL